MKLIDMAKRLLNLTGMEANFDRLDKTTEMHLLQYQTVAGII